MKRKTAQNHRMRVYRKKKSSFNVWPILIPLFVILGIIAYVFCTDCHFGGKNKVSIAIQGKEGEIIVSTFDPEAGEITNITIPANTQLTVSRQLGSWKSKSLWKLGENEKMGGVLMQESIVRNFHFPVSAWANDKHLALAEGKIFPMLGSLFSFGGSNMGFGDKINLIIYSLGVSGGKRIDMNLENTSYLRKEKLVDGEMGYVPTSKIPNNLLVVFGSQEYGRMGYKAVIKDNTGKLYVAQEVGSTLEVLGIKAASVDKGEKMDFDCLVRGENKTMVNEVSLIYSCGKKYEKPEGNFDLVLELGEKFGKRY